MAVHGYSITSGTRDLTRNLSSLKLMWGCDHRTGQIIPPSGELQLHSPDGGLVQSVLENGLEVEHPELGVVFRADAAEQSGDDGDSRFRDYRLYNRTHLLIVKRDAPVLWSRPHVGEHNRPQDFRRGTTSTEEWILGMLEAAYPESEITVRNSGSGLLQWHTPLTARWHVPETGRIINSWTGWWVFADGMGRITASPGDQDAGERFRSLRVMEDDIGVEDLAAGVVECGLYTRLVLEWRRLYDEAFPDYRPEVPMQVLWQNEGAEDVYGIREAVIPALPPRTLGAATMDPEAFGENEPTPFNVMRNWQALGLYGDILRRRSAHRRACTFTVTGKQRTDTGWNSLRELSIPGRTMDMRIDGSPSESWNGYGTSMVVTLGFEGNSVPQWNISVASLSGLVPDRGRMTVGQTQIPALLEGAASWANSAWGEGKWGTAVPDDGITRWGESLWGFNTWGASAPPPPLEAPTERPRVVSFTSGQTTYTVSWNAIARATGYRWTLTPSGRSGTVTGTSLALTGLNAGTAYELRLRAYNASGEGPVEIVSFTTNTVAPPPVSAPTQAPTVAISGIGENQATASWGAIAGATDYTWSLSPGGRTGTTSDTRVTITGLSDDTAYTVTVRGRNTGGVGPGGSAAFRTIETVEPPVGGSGTRTFVLGSGSSTPNFAYTPPGGSRSVTLTGFSFSGETLVYTLSGTSITNDDFPDTIGISAQGASLMGTYHNPTGTGSSRNYARQTGDSANFYRFFPNDITLTWT